MTTPYDFSAIPVLDYSLLDLPATRIEFLEQLRHALINVGFLYLSNHSVSQSDIDLLISYIPKFFGLPQETKDKLGKVNSPHFLGYSKLGASITKSVVDQREQFDIGTEHICRWKKGDPDYYRIWGPSQWPDEALLPGFRDVFERYVDQVKELSYKFSSLIAEAFGLGPGGFSQFYDTPELMQHRCKFVGYPAMEGSHDQGVGPHYDAGFLTFLLQASPHKGLQVQNLSGQWIDVPPTPGTFVVNIGRSLELVSGGLIRATCHRVLSPTGDSPRYSVPFFQNIALDIRLLDHVLKFPSDILALGEARGQVVQTDSVNLTEHDREQNGKVLLIGRVKSYPDAGERHYPEIFKQLFPDGHSGFGVGY